MALPGPVRNPGAPPFRTTTAFRVVLALYTLFAVGRFGDVMPIFYRIPVAKLLGLPMLIMVFTAMAPAQARAAFSHRTTRAVAALVCIAVISTPFSIWPGNSVSFMRTTFLPLMLYFGIAVCAMVDRKAMRTTMLTLVVGVALQAGKLLVHPNAIGPDNRVLAGSLDPNDTGALLCLTIPLAVAFAAERGLARRIFFGGISLLMVAAAVKTGSRGAFLGLIAVAACSFIFAPPRRRLVFGVAIVAGGVVFAAAADEALMDRFTTTFSHDEDYNFTARDGRIEIWKRGIGLMLTHPVFGVGPDSYQVADGTLTGKANQGFGIKYSAAHNSFIQLGVELGVFGLAAFCTAIGSAGVSVFRQRRRAIALQATVGEPAVQEAALAAAVLTSLIGMTVTGFFLSFGWMPQFYFPLALCVAVSVSSQRIAAGQRAIARPMARRGLRGGMPPAAAASAIAAQRAFAMPRPSVYDRRVD